MCLFMLGCFLLGDILHSEFVILRKHILCTPPQVPVYRIPLYYCRSSAPCLQARGMRFLGVYIYNYVYSGHIYMYSFLSSFSWLHVIE